MLLKYSGARLECGRVVCFCFFFAAFSVHMLTVDHLMAYLIAVAPASLSVIGN